MSGPGTPNDPQQPGTTVARPRPAARAPAPTTGSALAIPESVSVVETTASAVAAQAKASVEARYLVAMQRPRDWEKVERTVLAACKRPLFAERARYKKPIGSGKHVEGPSIRFAEACMRAMGNVLAEATVVLSDPEKRIIRVTVTDLETNVTVPIDVVVEKTVERKAPRDGETVLSSRTNSRNERTYLIAASEDALLVKQNAMVSKALRTGIERIFPDDIMAAAMQAVEATLRGESREEGVLERMVRLFGELGIKEPDLVGYLGHPLEQITPAEFASLRSIGKALEDGETTWAAVIADLPKTVRRREAGIRSAAAQDSYGGAGEREPTDEELDEELARE